MRSSLLREEAHDNTNQLLSDGSNSWTYDANGNRTNSGYTTTTGNRYTTDGTWDYDYDAEGNLTSKEDISFGEYWEYGYDHKNRLTSVVTKSSSGGSVTQEVQFVYDALGNRVEKSVDPDGAGSTPATIEKFGYDPNGNVWADLNSSGSLVTRRLYHNAVDALFARIDSNVDWNLADHQGSITDMIDSSGTLQNHIEYDGYGNIISETNSSFGDRYKYTSREWDAEIDLQYNRARFYDPTIGRWISEDPIGFNAGDTNLQRYVNNAPTLGTDPSGLSAQQNQNLVKNGPEIKLSQSKISLGGVNYLRVKFFKDTAFRKQNLFYATRIQVVSNSKESLGKVRFIQFVKREYKNAKGQMPSNVPYVVAKLDINDIKKKNRYFSRYNSKDWFIDTASNKTIFYEVFGPSSFGKENGLWEKSMYDEPTLDYERKGLDSQVVKFRTFILYENKIVYQIQWNVATSVKENSIQFKDPETNVTSSGQVKSLTSFPVDIFSKDWLWAYKDPNFESKITAPNLLLK